jgi:hypothetical protein
MDHRSPVQFGNPGRDSGWKSGRVLGPLLRRVLGGELGWVLGWVLDWDPGRDPGPMSVGRWVGSLSMSGRLEWGSF